MKKEEIIMDKKELWTLAAETMRAFAPFYRETMRKAAEEADIVDVWYPLRVVRASDPQPISVDRLHEMAPYATRERQIEILENLAQVEMLERVGEEAYQLLDQGRRAIENIFEAAHQNLSTVKPLPADEMEQLNDLLYRLVEATLEAPEPEHKWALLSSRWTDPKEDTVGTAKADQYLTDLYMFRDDAHIAAWKPYDVSGHAWEALTFIWRDELNTAEGLAERLGSFRGYTAEGYQEALQELADRGWVVEEAGAYKLTEKGRQVRDEAEEATDRYFYAGWSALSKDELAKLADLLTRTKEKLLALTLEQLWSLARETSQAIPAAVRNDVNSLFEEYGLDKPGYFFILLTAKRLEPDPISVGRLSARGPYTNPTVYDGFLTEVVEAGFIAPRKKNGGYELTEKGRTALQEVNHAFYTKLGELSTLPEENLTQIGSLLGKVAQACLDAEEPANKPHISTSRQGHSDQEYAPLAKIDQHLDDLNGFRDDAHIAAWEPYEVSGYVWETLTYLWRDEAHTAKELAELPFRGHSEETYTGAFATLVSRGWAEETADGYQITEKGRKLRQQAEEKTDDYFFTPWACLSAAEKIQLHDLLTRLKNNLQEMTENDADTS
jgi:DNA-binding MarR family transcriptional regulator